jgi:ERO1-like protein beta
VTDVVIVASPYKNRNLLQRSEVVALFNTLHRFSESLHVTDVFRDMWKESNADATSSILDKVESRTVRP